MPRTLLAIAFCAAFLGGPASVLAGEGSPVPSKEEITFHANVIEPALRTVKKAMPPAPKGWVVESESPIESQPTASAAAGPAARQNIYTITYKRTEGIAADMAKLDEAYQSSRRKHGDEARDRLQGLEKKRADAEKALQKAKHGGNKAEERKLASSLEDINKKYDDAVREIDRKVMADTEPFLVKDAMIAVRVLMNESAAEFPSGKGFRGQRAAFALRREGEREGDRGWKEQETFLLYGNWREVSKNRFVATMQDYRYWPKVQTINLSIIGEPSRVDQFLAAMDIRSMLNLMR